MNIQARDIIKTANFFTFQNFNSEIKITATERTHIQMDINVTKKMLLLYKNEKWILESDNTTISWEMEKGEFLSIIPYQHTDVIMKIWNVSKQNIPPKIKTNIEYIFVINMAKDIYRKNKIIELFKKYNITKYEFYTAQPKEKWIKEYKQNRKNGSLIHSSGHFGCLKSHLDVLKLAKYRNYSNVLILEDDIYMNENIIEKFENLELPKSKIIYFNGINNRIKLFHNEYAYAKNIMGCFAYLVFNTYIDTLIRLYETKNDCIDIMLSKIQPDNSFLILNNFIYTTIDDTNTSGKTDTFTKNFNKIFIGKNPVKTITYKKFQNYSCISNLFNINPETLTDYNIYITDFYFYSDEIYENELDTTTPWNNYNPNITINETLLKVLKNANFVFHKTRNTFDIFYKLNINNVLVSEKL